MTLSKYLAAAAIGALSISSGALAKRELADAQESEVPPEVNRSRVSCQAVSFGSANVTAFEAIVDLAVDASAFICGDTAMVAPDIASATASAFAIAVAHASASCEVDGDVSFQVEASASARAAAEVFVAAYASAVAEADVCDKCNAFAQSFGFVEQTVFLEAVASAEVTLDSYVDAAPGQLIFSVLDVRASVQGVVAEAFAGALAAAADLTEVDGCFAWANAAGCIYTPERPWILRPDCLGFDCTAVAVSVGVIEQTDAIARAQANASLITCSDFIEVLQIQDSASALAEATAFALSFAFAECTVDGGFGCSSAISDVTATAMAVAQAFSNVWADVNLCDGTCVVDVQLATSAIGDVLVTASTDAFATLCTNGGNFSQQDLAAEIQSASLCAIADAIATAISLPPGDCLASGELSADASEDTCPFPMATA